MPRFAGRVAPAAAILTLVSMPIPCSASARTGTAALTAQPWQRVLEAPPSVQHLEPAGDHVKRASQYFMPAQAFTRIFFVLDGKGGGRGTQRHRAVVYRSTGPDGMPTEFVAASEVRVVTQGATADVIDFPFRSSPVLLTTGHYWLGLHSSGNRGVTRFAWYDPPLGGGSNTFLWNDDHYGDGPARSFGRATPERRVLYVHVS